VPPQEIIDAKVKEAQEIYAADFKQATKPNQKAALGRTILRDGEGTQNDAAARYVLFDIARKVYIGAAEVPAALQVARQIEREFDVPANQVLEATITTLNAAPTMLPEHRAALARAAAELADELIAAGHVERADELASIAAQSAGKQKDPELKKQMQQRKTQVERIAKQHAAVKAHLETLAAKPDDPAANLAAGKFHCLVLEDWGRGLAQLAAAEGSPYAAPAKLDLDAGSDASKQLKAAESWLDFVEATRDIDRDERQALRRRAKQLLQTAVGELTGLDQIKAQKRIEELKDVNVLPAKAGIAKPGIAKADPAPANVSLGDPDLLWTGLGVPTGGQARGKEFQRVELRMTKKDTRFFTADYSWSSWSDRKLSSGKYDANGTLAGDAFTWTGSTGSRGSGTLKDGALILTWDEASNTGENWYVPVSKATAVANSSGTYEVYEEQRRYRFRLELRGDGSAQRSHSPSVPGAWLGTDERWMIVWADGWRDLILNEDGALKKYSFPPGALLSSQAVNLGTLRKLD
jgi:hypothetical protein